MIIFLDKRPQYGTKLGQDGFQARARSIAKVSWRKLPHALIAQEYQCAKSCLGNVVCTRLNVLANVLQGLRRGIADRVKCVSTISSATGFCPRAELTPTWILDLNHLLQHSTPLPIIKTKTVSGNPKASSRGTFKKFRAGVDHKINYHTIAKRESKVFESL